MDGPSLEVISGFVHPGTLLAPVRTLLGAEQVPVTQWFSGREWPSLLEGIRGGLEQRLGHPLTECLAEWHPDSRMGRRYLYEELAPKSSAALVTNGVTRTLRFHSYASWQHHVDRPVPGGSLLVINDINLRRWQLELLSEGESAPNVRLLFRYRLSLPK